MGANGKKVIRNDGKRKTMKTIKQKAMLFLMAVTFTISLNSCSSVKMIQTHFYYKKNLCKYKDDKRILFEKGADSSAQLIALKLDSCIAIVESFFGTPFHKPVVVTVCRNAESYAKRCGADTITRGMTNWDRIFLPPKAFVTKTEIPILIHELTHLHTFLCIGTYRTVSNIPGWFTEGLAVLVSQGAGAEKYSDSIGYSWIREGNHLTSLEKGNIFNPSGKNDRHLPWPMLYRQAYLFVKFLSGHNDAAFQGIIKDIEAGKDFKKAFQMRFGNKPSFLFAEFRKSISVKLQ
jgi:hypothetical protein